MASERRSGGYARLADNPVIRVAAYYVILFAATGLLIQLVPESRTIQQSFRKWCVAQSNERNAGPSKPCKNSQPIFARL